MKNSQQFIPCTSSMISIGDIKALDPMTALLNKKTAWPYFEKTFAESRRKRVPFSMLFIDIDKLKEFNDTHSLNSGDKAIRVVANILSEYWTHQTVPCRYGGEEFAVCLLGQGQAQTLSFAEKILSSVSSKVFPDFHTSDPVSITVSIGIACAMDEDEVLAKLLVRADRALMEAKDTGRNRVILK